jgi:hypothetical protein
MIWPTVCVDNFFDDPIKVKNFALNLNYKKDPEGKWPGERTDYLHAIDRNFFEYVCTKIIRLLYPMDYSNIYFNAVQNFQKVNGGVFKNQGWVHTDFPKEITAIIYLSEHKNCGTSLFYKKDFNFNLIHNDKKQEMYKNTKKDFSFFLNENNNQFEKTLTINSKFNRLVLFDSSHYHAADKFNDSSIKEDRLTLVTFFNQIGGENIKYPIPEMKRI